MGTSHKSITRTGIIPTAVQKPLNNNKSIKRARLPHGQTERAALTFLLEKRYPFGPQAEPSLLEVITQSVLAMDCTDNSNQNPMYHTHYTSLGPDERKMAELLRDNREVVEITLQTLFQFFGTNGGRSELHQLWDLVKEIPNKP